MAFATRLRWFFCHFDPFTQNRKPFIRSFLPIWMGLQYVVGSGLYVGPHRGMSTHSWAQYAWGSRPWPRPSIRLSSFAKLQGTTHYGVILLIGPLSSPPHSCRVPPHSVRMEYACEPPPWKLLHQGPPSFSHVKALAGKYCAFKLK